MRSPATSQPQQEVPLLEGGGVSDTRTYPLLSQTGHRSMPVLRGYIRRATAFEENAAVAIVDPRA